MLRYLVYTLWGLVGHLERDARVHSSYPPPSQPPRAGSAEQPSAMAWVTLGLGISAWFLLPLIAALLGAVLGWVELKKIEAGESAQAGKTITQVGFWLSVANIALSVLGTCAAIAIFVVFYGGIAALFVALGLSSAAAP